MALLKLDFSGIQITVLRQISPLAPYSSWQNRSENKKPEIPFIAKIKPMRKGIVKFFNQAKGFGCIRSEEGEEIFVHMSSLIDNARENDAVIFEIQNSPKGPKAVNVILAK